MKKRAFTLFETVVTLGLAGLVLGISGQILLDYGRVTKQARMHADGRELAAQGLRVLARQLRMATEWTEPDTVGEHALAVSWKYWTVSPEQWLVPAADGSWDPSPTGRCAAARAWLDDDHVLRMNGPSQVVLAREVAAFSVYRWSIDLINLKAEVNDGSRSLTVNTAAMRMAGQ